jgi:hypothetical protein
LHAIISDAAATIISPSSDATAKPTATPSEDDGKLDGNDGSVDVIAI